MVHSMTVAGSSVADKSQRRLRPRDAATLVLVDRSGTEPRVLMGRRRDDLVFMPGLYVFPGGRVDASDRTAPACDVLCPGDEARLLVEMKGRASARRARALALAAIREAFEETGVIIGHRVENISAPATDPWYPFLATGHLPRLGVLTLLARAITPPGRPRRFDTRFFVADASDVAGRRDHLDGELSSVGWFTFGEMRALDLPRITRVVVEDLADFLAEGGDPSRRRPVPFYFFRGGSFRRKLLSHVAGET